MSSPTIVIDAGHGGRVPAGNSSPFGVRGADGAIEKDVVLALAKRVAAHLGQPGAAADSVLTRTGDVNLPIAERAAVARRLGAPVFVSLHADQSRGAGAQAFVHPRAGGGSHALASALATSLARLGGSRARPVSAAEMAVLTPEHVGPSTAACLLEVESLGDPDGARRLGDPRSLDRLARGIASGINRYLGRARRGQLRGDEALLAPQVVVGIVGVGVATFSLINALESRTSGGLTWKRNISRCTHAYPDGVSPKEWQDKMETILNIDCTSGMSGALALFGVYFRCNGNDIDQCRVDKYNSSDWTISKLDVTFEGQDAVSYEENSVGAIVIYLTGTLDPTGSGDIDFSGSVLVKADGSVRAQGDLSVTRGDPSDFEIAQLDFPAGFSIKKK